MGHIKIVQALLSVDGIKINAFNTDGYAALISSSLNGHHKFVMAHYYCLLVES